VGRNRNRNIWGYIDWAYFNAMLGFNHSERFSWVGVSLNPETP